MSDSTLDPKLLETLRNIPTPAVSNAIETFDIRPRTQGFMGPDVRPMSDSFEPIIGRAVTARTVSIHPPGSRGASPRPDYWRYIEAGGPGPLISVVQDLDDPPTIGAFFGEVNSNVHKALGCVGAITNSGIRDIDEVEELGFPIWAKCLIVSHAYVYLVDYGTNVTVGGLVVKSGDLLLADRHGVIEIPLSIAKDIPEAVKSIEVREKTIIKYCQSDGFNADGLADIYARFPRK